jgi:ABC-2 type transport system permease protein
LAFGCPINIHIIGLKPTPGFQVFYERTKTFLRDPAEWSQLFMIAALVVVYLYSFKALPVERSPLQTEYVTNLISFLNVGMTGFIITSLAGRFVFPAVGAETAAFWLILSAPLSVGRYLLYKFVFYIIPFTLLSLLLVVTSDSLLAISGPMWWFSVTASLVICWTVVSMAVGCGALSADFKAENRAAALGGMGALLFLFSTMTVVFLIVAGGAFPMYHFMKQWIAGREIFLADKISLLAWFAGSLLLGTLSVAFFWRKGRRSLIS